MTLAEIIEEAKRLDREATMWSRRFGDIVMRGSDEEARRIIVEVGEPLRRLVAVAEAAVEMRANLSIRYFDDACSGEPDHQWVLHEGLAEALAAFDALASPATGAGLAALDARIAEELRSHE